MITKERQWRSPLRNAVATCMNVHRKGCFSRGHIGLGYAVYTLSQGSKHVLGSQRRVGQHSCLERRRAVSYERACEN